MATPPDLWPDPGWTNQRPEKTSPGGVIVVGHRLGPRRKTAAPVGHWKAKVVKICFLLCPDLCRFLCVVIFVQGFPFTPPTHLGSSFKATLIWFIVDWYIVFHGLVKSKFTLMYPINKCFSVQEFVSFHFIWICVFYFSQRIYERLLSLVSSSDLFQDCIKVRCLSSSKS